MAPKVILSVDGACTGNPGPGGYGVVLRFGEHKKELSGYNPATTNNQMELQAVIAGCEALKKPCEITLRTDSQYVITSLQNLDKYIADGFMNDKGKLIPNAGLLLVLSCLKTKHTFVTEKVKAHTGDEDNERCDQLAKQEIENNFTKAVKACA